MILYLTIIFVASCTVALFNALFASMGAGIAVLHTALNVVLMVAIDAIVALIVHSVPEEKIDPFKKIFVASNKERKFYEKLGVRVWKDIIPESGKALAGFDKRQVEKPNDNTYILKFLRETCYAGIMHVISIFACFVVFAFMPYKLSIVLPVVLTNVFLQVLPVIVQRYNRIRLISLYYFNKRHQEREQNEQN